MPVAWRNGCRPGVRATPACRSRWRAGTVACRRRRSGRLAEQPAARAELGCARGALRAQAARTGAERAGAP